MSRSGSSSSDASASSSIVYDHEPFATFRARVLDLALSLWPGSDAGEFVVERLGGGARCWETRYIVRIPRFDSARVDEEVAILYYVARTTIPAPTAITFDTMEENALGLPYMIRGRIPGTDLYSCFPTLDHAQKLRIARELGDVFLQMLEARGSMAGRFVLDGENGAVRIAPIPQPATPLGENEKTPSEVPPGQWLSAFFSVKHARPPLTTFWPEFGRMARELALGGWLNDLQYSLAHLDLAPRNILVDLTAFPNPPRRVITGILDWDSAVLAPRFLSCYPPLWIWAWQDDEDEDERAANDDPGTAQGRELKAQFEEARGTDYVRLAYGAPYRLARRLVRFAVDGIRSSEDYKEAEAMLQEWAEVRAAADLAGYEEEEGVGGGAVGGQSVE